MTPDLEKKAARIMREMNSENKRLKAEIAKRDEVEKIAYLMIEKGVPGWDPFSSWEDRIEKLSQLEDKNLEALREAVKMFDAQSLMKIGSGLKGHDYKDPLEQFVMGEYY